MAEASWTSRLQRAESKISEELKAKIAEKKAAIISGEFQVPRIETPTK